MIPAVAGQTALENGQVIARMETQVQGLRTFPPGTYHVYLAKIGGTWRALAESGGRIVAQSSKVLVGPKAPSTNEGFWVGVCVCGQHYCVCVVIYWD